jgi:Histidine phosphatase superfamily (branch 1)
MKKYIKVIPKHQLGGNVKPDNIKIIKINFFFVRHAFSCANVKTVESQKAMIVKKIISKVEQILEADPNLTKEGFEQSHTAGEKIKNNSAIKSIDYLFSSPLVRAIETAHAMFIDNNFTFTKPDNKKVYIAPYLKELGETDDNVPLNPKDQIAKRIKLLYPKENYIIQLKQNSIIRGYKDDKEGYNGDLFKFINWFLNTYFREIKNLQEINVVAVTHSSLIQENFKNFTIQGSSNPNLFQQMKPKNNSVYQLAIELPSNLNCSEEPSFTINPQTKNIHVSTYFGIPKILTQIYEGLNPPQILKPNCEETCTFYDESKCKKV